jgi:hypothetical protein
MSTKTSILLTIAFFIMLFGMAFLVTKDQKPDPETKKYTAEELDRPKAEVKENLFDVGEMKVDEIKEVSFSLKNIGNKPLQILNINSSCNCTFGKVLYKDIETKQFGMHKQSGYVTDIAPQDTATVKVIYNPSIMPVYGNVSRDVYITTNDPENSKLIFTIKTFVK